jgi:hypothetical protein
MRPIVEHRVEVPDQFFHRCHRVLPLLCLLAGCLFAPGLSAQPAAAPKKPAPAQSANRFLFIVDTSTSMEKHRDDELDVVDEILRSSANGQLHRGDSIGVWTFNAEIYTGNMPLQVWLPEQRQEIALRTEEFIREQTYRKTSRFDIALSSLYQVIKNSDIITVFIISNGNGKMQGSPFDDEINALYQENVKEMKKNRMPVVTVLQAKGGKILKYTVNAVPWPVVVPELPIVLKAETGPAPPPAAPLATTNSTPPKPAPPAPALVAQTPPAMAPASAPAPPPTNLPPIVTTYPSPAPVVATPAVQPESPQPVAQVSPVPPNANPPTPGMPVPQTPAPVTDARTPQTGMPVPETRMPVASMPAPPNIPPPAMRVAPKPNTFPPPVNPQVQQSTPTMPGARVVPSDTRTPATVATTPEPAPTTQPAKSFVDRILAVVLPEGWGYKRLLLIGGVALLVLGFGLILLLVRRSRRPPERISLISHVMDKRQE